MAGEEECKRLLYQFKNGKADGIVTDSTIYSIMVLMGRLKKFEPRKTFLSSLTAYKALYIYTTSLTEKVKAAETALKNNLDIDDAIQYVAALSTNAEAIISFDKHLDKLKLTRKEPNQITS
ncbi:MAG: PIN domain-containing protein [Candidatus Bathyarchaeia archaeon]